MAEEKKKKTTSKKGNTTNKKNTKSRNVEKKEQIEKSNTIKVEINKDKLIKTVLVTLGIIILCLICFFASTINSKEYSKTNIVSSTEDVSEDDTSGLEQATSDAGSVSDDERVEPDEIVVSDYLELYKADSNSLVLLSRPTCEYCKLATPILENIIYETGVKINYINVDNLSDDDKSELIASDSYFEQGFGTPLIMVVGNNSIVDKIEGLTTMDGYKSFFKQYGFID